MISIVVPLHNKGAYIEQTVQSVLEQSCADWELLVVENGSTDDGPQRVAEVSDSRVRLLRAPSDVRGPCAARNVGLESATRQHVLFLDADDLLDPQHLQSLSEVLSESNADIAASGWREFRDSEPNVFEAKDPLGRDQGDLNLSDCAIAFAPWAVHCALVRRDILVGEFTWPVELDDYLSEDTAFWFKLVSCYSVTYSQLNSAMYRTHTENLRNEFQNLKKWSAGIDAVIRVNLAFLESRGTQVSARQCESLMRLWADISEQAEKSGELEAAKGACDRAQAWLEQCKATGGIDTISLKARSALTMKRFQRIKRWLSKPPN